MLPDKAKHFENLYNDWFVNHNENTKYILDNYFDDIKFIFECNIDDFDKYNKKIKIGAIIAFDQLPGKFAELYEINNNAYKKIYSKIAAEISCTFIYKNLKKNDDISIREWYYILMPFININDKQNIQLSIDIMKLMYQNPYISKNDKDLCKTFISLCHTKIKTSNI
jgi:hypothetical protein